MIVTPRARRDTHNIKTNILRVRRVRRVTYRVMKVTPIVRRVTTRIKRVIPRVMRVTLEPGE